METLMLGAILEWWQWLLLVLLVVLLVVYFKIRNKET